MPQIYIKRVYEKPSKQDGFRVLIDRLWPRGIPKASAKISLWYKDIAPSNELRQWFGHDPKRWPEFRKRYAQEIRQNKPALAELKKIIAKHPHVTLLFGAKDEEHNNAVVLKKLITDN